MSMSNFAYTEKSKFVNPRLTEHSKTMEQKFIKQVKMYIVLLDLDYLIQL